MIESFWPCFISLVFCVTWSTHTSTVHWACFSRSWHLLGQNWCMYIATLKRSCSLLWFAPKVCQCAGISNSGSVLSLYYLTPAICAPSPRAICARLLPICVTVTFQFLPTGVITQLLIFKCVSFRPDWERVQIRVIASSVPSVVSSTLGQYFFWSHLNRPERKTF